MFNWVQNHPLLAVLTALAIFWLFTSPAELGQLTHDGAIGAGGLFLDFLRVLKIFVENLLP